jgi:hypothetical protein
VERKENLKKFSPRSEADRDRPDARDENHFAVVGPADFAAHSRHTSVWWLRGLIHKSSRDLASS